MKAPVSEWKDFEKQLVSEGLVDAKCYGVIDLGSSEFEYQGEKKTVRKVQLSFETQQMWTFGDRGELPLTVHTTKTFSLHEKSKLYSLIKDWALKEATENMFNLVGMPVQLMISHSTSKTGKVYADILKIKPSKNDFDLVNPTIMFSLDAFNQEEFDKLPDRLKKQIIETSEYKNIKENEENDLPF